MTETTGAERVRAYVAETTDARPMVRFTKGTPARPQNRFSAVVSEVLRHYDLPVYDIDVLAPPAELIAGTRPYGCSQRAATKDYHGDIHGQA